MKPDFIQVARELGPVIGTHIDDDDKNRRLSAEVINTLKEAGLYKLLLPKSLGGYEIDPVTTAKSVEQIAMHNTAAGWSMMVANTSHWWGRNLYEKGIETLYASGSETFVAGAIHPPMQGIRTEGGIRITGRTPLASNVHEAQWLFITAMLFEDGKPKMNNGMPEVTGTCVKASDLKIIDSWYTVGMKSTDSNDILAENVFVPDHLVFPLMPGREPNKYFDAPLYRFPTIGISVPTMIAPVALGTAATAIKELKAMAAKKTPMGSIVSIREKGVVQRKLGMAEAVVQAGRAYLYQTLSNAWKKTLAGEKIEMEEKADLLLCGAHTVQSCLHAIDMMYSAAGSSAIYLRSKLAHCFMDAQVIRQHGFVNESRYETAGQVYMGLPPDLAVVGF